MNAIILAHKTMLAHIETMLKGQQSTETLIAEYMKMKKEDLARMLAEQQKVTTVKVEDVCKVIMEDPACAWLTWSDIAETVSKAMGSNTSDKCLASYSSKYPKTKGWVVISRKSTAERNQEFMKLAR